MKPVKVIKQGREFVLKQEPDCYVVSAKQLHEQQRINNVYVFYSAYEAMKKFSELLNFEAPIN